MAKEAVERIKAVESEALKIIADAENEARQIVQDAKNAAKKLVENKVLEAKAAAAEKKEALKADSEKFLASYVEENKAQVLEPIKEAQNKKDEAISAVIGLLF